MNRVNENQLQQTGCWLVFNQHEGKSDSSKANHDLFFLLLPLHPIYCAEGGHVCSV